MAPSQVLGQSNNSSALSIYKSIKTTILQWLQKINHLLFMDDLKLFGKNQNQIDSLVNTVYLFSSDVGMEFGIRKCGVLVMKKGKAIATDGIELPDRQVVKDIEENGYKYLGILEMDKIK